MNLLSQFKELIVKNNSILKTIFSTPSVSTFGKLQQHSQITLKDGKVYHENNLFCLFKEQKIDKWTIYYEFTRNDKVQLFNVIKTVDFEIKSFRITFPSIDTYFDVNYGNLSIEEILISYINNKIIEADLKVNKSALEAYAETREIRLRSILKLTTLKVSANATTYTPAISSGTNTHNTTTSSALGSVSFSLTNTSGENVRIFIGDTPKYGSGTTGIVSGNSVERRTAKVGNQICILDASDNPISCFTVTELMGEVVINKSGTDFGY